MKDHFNVFSCLLFIASATSNLAASDYADPEDPHAIAPRIGMHFRVLPVSGSYDEEAKYTSSVFRVKIQNLVQTYQFNSESAQCFVGIRDNVYSPLLDHPFKSTKAFRSNVRGFLMTCELLPAYLLAENQAEIVSVFYELLQRRHALLNYVLPQAAGAVEQHPYFSLHFPDAHSVRETFMQSLVNMVDNSLEIKMSQDLKTQFSTLEAWTAILTAFSAHNDALSPFAQNSFSFDLREPCCVVM